jgi:DNA-binding XRE family transcriptional regulator
MAKDAPKAATPAQVAAWRNRMGYTNEQAAKALDVSERTFYRWLAGDSDSPRWLRSRFLTEGVK